MGTQDIVQRMTDAYLEQGGASKGIDHDLAVKVYRQFAAEASDGMVAYPNVARMMGVSERTLWRLLSGHKLPQPVRIGRNTRWRLSEVTEWIEKGCPIKN